MRRLATILALLLAATPAWALTFAEQVAAALVDRGYEVVEMERTLFGRLRVVAEDGESRRELVFNPGTGEVLRDWSVPLAQLEETPRRRDDDDNDEDRGAVAATGEDMGTAALLDERGSPEVVIPDPLSLGGD